MYSEIEQQIMVYAHNGILDKRRMYNLQLYICNNTNESHKNIIWRKTQTPHQKQTNKKGYIL